jgi:hypothetical protein
MELTILIILILFFIIMGIATKSDNPRFDNSKEFFIIAFTFFILFLFFLLKEFK